MGLELDDSSSGELDGARNVAGFDDEAGILYDPLPIVHPYQMPGLRRLGLVVLCCRKLQELVLPTRQATPQYEAPTRFHGFSPVAPRPQARGQ